MKKIEIIVGSNAKNSLQKKLANSIKEIFRDKADFSVLEISELPIYSYENENLENEKVKEYFERLKKADGVIVLAAEYNGSIHSMLKNALDYTSRGEQVLKNKPVFVTGASPSNLGTARAQDHTKHILSHQYIAASVLPGNQVLISNSYNKFDENGKLNDEDTIKFLGQTIDNFITWIDKIK